MKNLKTLGLTISLLLFSPYLLANSETEKAEQAYKKGHIKQAISHYQRASEQGSASPLSEFNLVRLYLLEERQVDVTRLLDKLAENQAESIDYMELKGDLARQLNDWEAARNWYLQALEAIPSAVETKRAQLQLKLGQALQQLGNEIAADKAFAEYARLEGISQSSSSNNSENSRKRK